MTQKEQIKAFEQALDNAWEDYVDRGAATVDALEENTQKLAFAKGYNAGYKQSVEYPTGGELLHVLNKGHEQGWKDAVRQASLFVYHLGAHPNVTIDGLELEKSFKEYMEKYENKNKKT